MGASRSGRVAAFLAGRSLLRGNWGLLVTTVAMMVLVYVNLLFLPSLIQGASDHLISRLIETTTADLQITPANKRVGIAEPGAYASRVARQPGVAAVASERLVGNRIFSSTNGGSWSVDAIEPNAYDGVFSTDESLIEGHWLGSSETDSIVLGVAIAGAQKRKLVGFRNSLEDVHTGDMVTVALTNGHQHAFRVVGVFDDEFRVADERAYVADAAARALLPGALDKADAVFVKTQNRAQAAKVRREIEPLDRGVKVETAAELEEPIHEQMGSDKLISNIMKVISALVAAITIFIVTYVDLVNRRRQIGIERAIGIRGGAIIGSYCLKAIAYAALGALVGALLFRAAIVPLVAHYPFHFPNGPVTLSPSRREMLRGALLLVVVAVIAAYLPARHTLKIKILDAIWG